MIANSRAQLAALVGGFRVSAAIHAFVALGVPDLLADGPRDAGSLAAEAGADSDALFRLLRMLSANGIVEARGERTFGLTELGEGLRSDVEGSLRPAAVFYGRPYVWQAWGELGRSIRGGRAAFDELHGQTVWEYRADRPEESEVFDRFMASLTRGVDDAIVAGYDFGRFGHVVDVGCGRGTLLAAILQRNPHVRGTLFDQEHVVAGAPDLERATKVSGSFFDEVPRGGDAYVLKSILHDWDDERAAAILRTVAAALDETALVLVVELDVDDVHAPLLDVQMLVMLGGRERTETEYAELFRAARLDLVGATPTGAGLTVFEARRAG